MVTHFAMDLFKDPFFIGFNRELDRMATVHNTASRQSYPPYDVLKLDEDTYKVLCSWRVYGSFNRISEGRHA